MHYNRTSQQPPPASGASGPSASSPGSSSHEASTHASQHPQASGASGLGPSSHGSSQHASPQPLASVSGTHGTDPSNTASEDAPQDVSNGIVIVDEDDEQLAPLAYPPGLMTFARREMIERSLKVSYKTGKPYPNTSDKPHYDKYKLEWIGRKTLPGGDTLRRHYEAAQYHPRCYTVPQAHGALAGASGIPMSTSQQVPLAATHAALAGAASAQQGAAPEAQAAPAAQQVQAATQAAPAGMSSAQQGTGPEAHAPRPQAAPAAQQVPATTQAAPAGASSVQQGAAPELVWQGRGAER
ncbi:hypothetical protein CYMTET_38730 [Cymbomonas tetramitiformis]|uniref:Uncharacterized protein n=2 Tax=Cymbomonas tetramitiformis TaxID=36881 RepID=A0AAE0CDI3_9CHLO|nr:hypothetical protein CYMTET_38730 [Cymbomonas tetramitiformis]